MDAKTKSLHTMRAQLVTINFSPPDTDGVWFSGWKIWIAVWKVHLWYYVQQYEMYYLMSLYLLPLRPTEAHWAVITGIPLWLSILSSWITSHIIPTFVHARQCQEPFVWHKHKSKSSSPSGLRLLDTSYRCRSSCKVWTWVVSAPCQENTQSQSRGRCT